MTVQDLIDLLSPCKPESTVYTIDSNGDLTDRFHVIVDGVVISFEEPPPPTDAVK